jgi:putative solute:sodium symporter small subunit
MPTAVIRPEVAASAAARRTHAYWRRLRRFTLVMLACWLAVSLAVPWFATELNAWRLGRFPLGFWLGAQGALLIFVLLIVVYVWVVERMDRAMAAAECLSTGVADGSER